MTDRQIRAALAAMDVADGIAPARCRGTKAGGEPCRWSAGLSPEGFCHNHDPSRRAAAQAIRAEGGRAAGAARRARRDAKRASIPDDVPPEPRSLDDAFRFAAWLTHAIATGRLDARTGHESGYCLQRFQSIAEKRDLERQIKQLRAELAEARKHKSAGTT